MTADPPPDLDLGFAYETEPAAPLETDAKPATIWRRLGFWREAFSFHMSDSVTFVKGIAFPMWVPLLIFGAPPVAAAVRELRSRRRSRNGRCGRCGYDLRASPGRCPECGEPVSVIGGG